MPRGQQLVVKAAGESQPNARTGSTPSLAQVLDRLATQLDDSTHTGIGLTVRLMIESREEKARERQADGYPLVKEMTRLRLPVDGPGAEDAILRFIHAARTPGTSSDCQAKLERGLFADIALVEDLHQRGEGQYLEIASAGKLTIADLVSRLVHLRTRLTFWATSLEVYPPPLVGDVVGLIAEAARQLRYAAHLPAIAPCGRNSTSDVASSANAGAPTTPSLSADHIAILRILAESQGRCRVIAELVDIGKYLKRGKHRDRETVGRYLLTLEKHGLVHRPQGRRKGRAITPQGLSLLETLGPEEQPRH